MKVSRPWLSIETHDDWGMPHEQTPKSKGAKLKLQLVTSCNLRFRIGKLGATQDNPLVYHAWWFYHFVAGRLVDPPRLGEDHNKPWLRRSCGAGRWIASSGNPGRATWKLRKLSLRVTMTYRSLQWIMGDNFCMQCVCMHLYTGTGKEGERESISISMYANEYMHTVYT